MIILASKTNAIFHSFHSICVLQFFNNLSNILRWNIPKLRARSITLIWSNGKTSGVERKSFGNVATTWTFWNLPYSNRTIKINRTDWIDFDETVSIRPRCVITVSLWLISDKLGECLFLLSTRMEIVFNINRIWRKILKLTPNSSISFIEFQFILYLLGKV